MNTSRPGATLLLSRPSIALFSRSLTAVSLRHVAGIQYSGPLEVVHALEPQSAIRRLSQPAPLLPDAGRPGRHRPADAARAGRAFDARADGPLQPPPAVRP